MDGRAIGLRVKLGWVTFSDAEADEAWSAIGGLGKVAGRPWRKDEKLAATAGWLALRQSAREST